jgi:uncharacterized membrane protein (Fun14 family)
LFCAGLCLQTEAETFLKANDIQFVCGTRSPEISIGAKSKGVVFGYAARSEMPRVVVVVVVVLLLLLLLYTIVNPALSAWEDISSSAASSGL